jgi:hypothetical protein
VQFLRRRAWYLTSIALGLAAIVIDLTSKTIVASGVVGTAAASHALSNGAASDVVAAMKDQAAAQVHRGTAFVAVGLLVALVSAICFFISRTRAEPGPRIVPVMVWTVYVWSLLVTV